jgi:hypothetical protein
MTDLTEDQIRFCHRAMFRGILEGECVRNNSRRVTVCVTGKPGNPLDTGKAVDLGNAPLQVGAVALGALLGISGKLCTMVGVPGCDRRMFSRFREKRGLIVPVAATENSHEQKQCNW